MEVDYAARICIKPGWASKGGSRPEKAPHACIRRRKAVFVRVRQMRAVKSEAAASRNTPPPEGFGRLVAVQL